MQTCARVRLFSCVPAPRGRITVALRVAAFRHLLSLMAVRCIIFSITLQSSDIVRSQSPLNSPGPGPERRRLAEWELQKRTRCHPLALPSFHLCPSNDCVPVFGREMGLCGAQRLQGPKAARQIRPLRSAMARMDRIPSSSFKLHFPWTTSATTGPKDFQFPVCSQLLFCFFVFFVL